VTLAHKQKHFLHWQARECAQNIFNSFETAEGGLGTDEAKGMPMALDFIAARATEFRGRLRLQVHAAQ
jgi:hypothetical protein